MRRGMRRSIPIASTLLVSILAAGSVAMAQSPSPAASGSTTTGEDTRDARYCEVIPVTTDGSTTTSAVYNTTGYSDCPEADWIRLTEQQINEAYGSQSAKKNGPRHWVMNAIANDSTPTGAPATFTFGTLEMALRGVLTTPADQPTVGDQVYAPNEVQRSTVFTYNAGEEIYELTDPDGNVYVMQSYAQIVDRTLTIDQLDELGSKLQLPEGWSYSTEVLAETLELDSGGLATVVNDDLYNSYQKR